MVLSRKSLEIIQIIQSMREMIDLLLATRNAHKTQEFAALLGAGFKISDLRHHPNIPAVAETGTTYEENAILKALAASRAIARGANPKFTFPIEPRCARCTVIGTT